MTHPRRLPAAIALMLLALPPLAARADSSSVASISASVSKAVGSVSDSIQGSSNSSADRRVAAGPYRVVEIAAADGRPGMERVQLQGDAEQFTLLLPAEVRQRAALQAGDRVAVSTPAYGVAFVREGAAEPFFLALDDAWRHEFQRQAVTR